MAEISNSDFIFVGATTRPKRIKRQAKQTSQIFVQGYAPSWFHVKMNSFLQFQPEIISQMMNYIKHQSNIIKNDNF